MSARAQPVEAAGDESLVAFRHRVRAWLAEEAPRHGWDRAENAFERRDADERVRRAREYQRHCFEAGFAGLTWPVEYGGQGLSNREQIVFNEEAAAYELPLMPLFIGLGMCGPTILAVGSEAQKQRYLRPLLRGDEIWCQLFSEPNAGSDVAGVETRAVRDGEEWVITGQKVWTSSAHYATFGLCLARTDAAAPKHRGLTMFVLDMQNPAVTARPLRQMNGAARFNEVFIDGERAGDGAVVGEVNEGWRAALATLMSERVSIGAGRTTGDAHSTAELIGAAQGAGRADDPLTRDALADLYVREQIVTWIGKRITTALLGGRPPGPEGSIAKLASTALAKRSAALGVTIAGAGGVAWDAVAPRGDQWADVLLGSPGLSIAGGTDEILKNIVGERVLGLPKDPPPPSG